MTDKEKLEKVRAEIERRKKEVEDNIFELGNFESERIGLFDNKEIYNDLLSFIDSMTKEPVSEDLDLGCGVIWKGVEPVSEDLEEAANEYAKDYLFTPKPQRAPNIHFINGANWQKQQDQSIIELAEDHAMLAGMEKMKEQMMAKAVDATVHIDAGGYPYIPQMELYDYDKDIPLAKEGDKYKLVLIKED